MDEPQWLDDREQRAWRGLMKLQAGLSEYIDRQLRTQSGLSTADYQVLAHLSEAPDGRLRSFALREALQWEKSRLSQHLTRMQNRNLIRRERCPTDQRGAIVVIAAQGRTLIEKAAPQHLADVRKVLIDHMTPEQMDLLSDLSAQVEARLAEINQQPG
ncbi:MarR family winged helix-turn-helix transcriptional regulator [Streptomyces sp. NPDC001286]